MGNRQGVLGMLPGLNQGRYGAGQALMNVGQQQQGLLQNALDMGYDEYRDARDWDVSRLQALTNALGSINGGTVQQSGANPNYRSAGQNAYSTALSLAGAWMSSSRELKDTQGPADPDAMLKAVRSWDLDHWKYKGEDTPHIGTYAEDFNKSLGLPEKPVIEFPDMFGALTGAIQSLDKKVQAIGSGKEKGKAGGQNWFGEMGKPRKVA